MKEIKVLKEAWDGMVQEGILDVITGKTDTQQNTDANQQQSTQPVVDPVKVDGQPNAEFLHEAGLLIG